MLGNKILAIKRFDCGCIFIVRKENTEFRMCAECEKLHGEIASKMNRKAT
jgi:hypothetical protein